MSAEPVHTIVLCEDLQHAAFVGRFLKLRGWHNRQIRTRPCPAGKGSGEQWVRRELPAELRAYRSRSSRAKSCLVVVLDADQGTVDQHLRELDQACRDAGETPRAGDERVLFVIPRRNIETWLAYLQGQAVDETSEYPRLPFERECRAGVAALDDMCRRQELREPAPPSLMTACDEHRRLDL